jgi:hypothetical protein
MVEQDTNTLFLNRESSTSPTFTRKAVVCGNLKKRCTGLKGWQWENRCFLLDAQGSLVYYTKTYSGKHKRGHKNKKTLLHTNDIECLSQHQHRDKRGRRIDGPMQIHILKRSGGRALVLLAPNLHEARRWCDALKVARASQGEAIGGRGDSLSLFRRYSSSSHIEMEACDAWTAPAQTTAAMSVL